MAIHISDGAVKAEDNPVNRIDVQPVNAKEKRELYSSRVKIFPKRVSGGFRRLKWWIMAATLAIYYFTPWIRWDRGPGAPDQAVLIDLANRRFYFFFIEIWPQEFFYLTGLLVMAGIGLFLVTSTVGRAWCGYTCPQTVWVDLFIVVERWVEGDRNTRIKLDKAPWTFNKSRKFLTKHAIWLLIAVLTGGAWIFYFADAPSLAVGFITGQAAAIAYTSVGILTATTYIFAGLMREQICTFMCPWPRIQGAMLDENSLVVTYQGWRGEPRSHNQKTATPDQTFGDCIDCNQCVAVCPMGIDIRDGEQLECITCALCIDACDNVMEKTGRAKGLISYTTYNAYAEASAGNPGHNLTWRTILRPRTFIYSGIWALAGLLMLFALISRDRLDLNVVRDRNPVFVQLSNGDIRNGYTIKILNMKGEPRLFRLSIEGLNAATMTEANQGTRGSRHLDIGVEADKLRSLRILVSTATSNLDGEQTPFKFVLSEQVLLTTTVKEGEQVEYEAVFRGPKN